MAEFTVYLEVCRYFPVIYALEFYKSPDKFGSIAFISRAALLGL